VLQLVYGKRQIQMSCEWEFTYNSILQSVDSIMDYDDNLAGYFSKRCIWCVLEAEDEGILAEELKVNFAWLWFLLLVLNFVRNWFVHSSHAFGENCIHLKILVQG